MRHLPIQCAAALLLGLLVPAAIAQQADKTPADRQLAHERQVARQVAVRQLQDSPSLADMPLSQVLQFRLESNNLTLYTELQPTAGPSRIHISDLSGLCSLDIHGFAQFKAPVAQLYTPMAYMLIRHDFNAPGCTESITTVSVTPMNLQVSLDEETLSETRNISLVESTGIMNADEPPVRLRITVQPKTADVPAVSIFRSAADFLTLRRQYRADTARYLEPIFRALHADAVVFDADPRVAWQVFAAQAQPDPAITAQVHDLLAKMDADDFHVRQSAAESLKQLGQPAAVALEHLDRSKLTPEQSSRVEAFLSAYHPVSDEQADRLRNDVNFLLDCLLEEDDPFIVKAALAQIQHVTGQELHLDPNLHGDDRRAAVANFRQQLTGVLPATQPHVPD